MPRKTSLALTVGVRGRLSFQSGRNHPGVVIQRADQRMLVQERQRGLNELGLPGNQSTQGAEPEFPVR